MKDKGVRVVDLRSDTVTKPTPAMRKAMAEAEVGDDVYNEDPTVNELQEKIAKFLGKEAALFVASGTMGNLSSVMAHCWTRGQEMIVGDQTHIFMYEQGGISHLAGVHISALRNLEDGTFAIEELKSKLRPQNPGIHEPTTGVICLENTNNRCGGRVLPMSFIQEVCAIARNHGVPVHMDGARIVNASVACGIPPHEIVKDCASVSMCLSKGIGAPVGSVVAGSKDFIAKVLRCRKVLGGAMRQVGVLAAAALVALETAEERIRIDHQRTKEFAKGIYNLNSKLVTADPDVIESNMVLLNFPSPAFTSEDFVRKMEEVDDSDPEPIRVRSSTWFNNRVRFVLHSDLSQEDVDCALKKISTVAM